MGSSAPSRAGRVGFFRIRGGWPALWGLCLAFVGLLGCRPALGPLDQMREFVAGPERTPFRVEFSAADQNLAPAIEAATRQAILAATRWGDLRAGVSVRVHPSHAALEKAIGHRGLRWLRAWAQYEVIHMQSPQTWGIPYEQQLVELLTHEITHVAMYQAVGGPRTWAEKDLPFWFREGMASVTARQGYRRPTERDVARALASTPGLDPLHPDPVLLREQKDLAYGAAHWAFQAMLDLAAGPEQATRRVRDLMHRVRGGASFSQAFRGAWGVSEAQFLDAWQARILAAFEEMPLG